MSEDTSGKQLAGCFGGGQPQEPPNADPKSTKIAFAVGPVIEGTASASASAEQTVSLTPRPGDDGRGICVMNADGTGLMRVVNTRLTSEGLPSWTPDGKKIGFVVDGVVYMANADGSHRTTLAWPEGPRPEFNTGPSRLMSWSPDGSRIAFQSDCNIYVVPADGSLVPRRLTTDPHWQCAQSPNWSRDGKRIAFTSGRGKGTFFKGASYDDPPNIYIVNARKGHTNQWRQLTDGTAGFIDISWSPDGTEMAFVRANGSSYDIYKIDVTSLKETRLTDSPMRQEEWPTWSPDRKKIAYSSNGEIYVMNADGSNPTSVASFSEAEAYAPSWQPLP